MTQEDLAEALKIDQTTVSKMTRGVIKVTVERVRVIEDLCGLHRGQILRWSGYVGADDELDRLEAEIVRRERPKQSAVGGRPGSRSGRGGSQ